MAFLRAKDALWARNDGAGLHGFRMETRPEEQFMTEPLWEATIWGLR